MPVNEAFEVIWNNFNSLDNKPGKDLYILGAVDTLEALGLWEDFKKYFCEVTTQEGNDNG